MNILLGYGYDPGTTGIYIEKCLSKHHNVTFVGTPWDHRPGYFPNVDVARLVSAMSVKPDLFLYVDSGNAPYAPIGLEKLTFPTVAYLIDAWPPSIAQRNTFRLRLAPLFDYLFVAHRGAAELYRSWRADLPAHWLPLACDPEIHADQHRERIHEVGFVGQYNPSSYSERAQMLDALAKRYRMNDFRRSYYLQDMARVYSESKIGFNISHSDILTMRFFEIPASGALLLTARSEHNGQSELLEEGECFVTFKGLDELMQKVDYYLRHDEERERIARAGQAHILAHHTYEQRMKTMLEVISADGARLCAPVRSWSAERCVLTYMELHSMLRLTDATMAATLGNLNKRRKLSVRARQMYHAITAMLRRIKHEWK